MLLEVVGGGGAVFFAETLAEVGGAAHPDHQGYLRDGIATCEQEFGGTVGAVFANQPRNRHAGDGLYFAIERGVRHAHSVGDEPYVEFLTGDVGKYDVANLTEKFTVGCCHFRYYGVGIGFSRGRDGAGRCRIGCSGDLNPVPVATGSRQAQAARKAPGITDGHSYRLTFVRSSSSAPIALSDVITGLDAIDADSAASPVTWYNLQGVEVQGDLAPGIYIRRQGNTAVKTVVR